MLNNDNILSVELNLNWSSTKNEKNEMVEKNLLVFVWGIINTKQTPKPRARNFPYYDDMVASLSHSASQIKIVVQFEIQNNKILSPQENQ